MITASLQPLKFPQENAGRTRKFAHFRMTKIQILSCSILPAIPSVQWIVRCLLLRAAKCLGSAQFLAVPSKLWHACQVKRQVQTWSLVFLNFCINKKWFFAPFIKLIWLKVGILNRTGRLLILYKKCNKIILYFWKNSKIPKVLSSADNTRTHS